ncbi:LuxR C-terminal-related transcriptional regulator [Kibdelosporangium aridum]|uniref:ATP-, maltotriose-and DNA-dependent transcriptional regulator MalT n=1 Tax=Kibdelosporangium aridum TaxID=2030 RepID=A0A1Y5YBJ8_KIBAR|nr:LuxR family transcriptional regulator [Kibdelosporangium aridum]SMD27151.1 ATP-, maltotriose-and DNA-dependent transcriptional regulator MalT [Kibdelosporangium aridum]
MHRSWPFVGRREELALVRATLRDPRVSGLVLAGEAGVGKSRLVREAVQELDERRYAAQVLLAGRAVADVPFGAVAYLLPAQLADVDPRLNVHRWVADQLVATAGERRLVLAVDDAHHLDLATAAVVAQLARSSAAFVLATVRNSEPAPEPVTALWKDEVVERADIDALNRDEIGRVLEAALRGPVEKGTRERLAALCQGNVLLLREVVIAAEESGALTDEHGIWRWSGTVAVTPRLVELVTNRIGSLDDEERHALEVAAFGEPLGVDIAAKLAGLELAERLEDKGLIVVGPDRRRTNVRLAHPLYGEVVRAGCPVLRARRIQQQLAEAVESTGARRRGDVLRVCVWRLESRTASDPDRLLAAGRQAWAAHDIGLACRIGRAALDAGGGVSAALLLSEVLNWAEQYEEAESVLSSVATQPMTDQQRMDYVTGRVQNLSFGLQRLAEADALLAVEQTKISDPAIRRQMSSYVANHRFWAGDCAEALCRSQELIKQPAVTPAAEATVWADAALSLSHSGRSDDAIAAIRRADETSEAWIHDLPLVRLILDTARHYANLFAGRLAEAERAASDVYQGTWDMAVAASELQYAHVARFRGQIHQAAHRSRAGAALGAWPSFLLRSACLGELAHATALGGNAADASKFLAQADELWSPALRPFQYWVDLARPWVSAAAGRIDEAISLALRIAASARRRGFVGIEVLALHDVVRLGEADLVTRRLSTLEAHGQLVRICAEHARAGEGPALDRVSKRFEELGMILHAAEASAQAATAHRYTRDQQRATMRALALAGRCDGARTPALRALHPPNLTKREREVAQLAATGFTTTAIADRLVLSPRTVENHLHRVFAKLHITSRAQLKDILPD